MRPLFTRAAAVALLALAGAAAAGHGFDRNGLHIGHPYARASPPGARTGVVYLTIDNRGTRADRLVAVSTPAAASAELHETTHDGNVARMRAVAGVDIPPGGKVAFSQGGLHVMLVDLAKPLVAGERFPLTLKFERAGGVDVTVDVQSMTSAPHGAH